MAHILVAYGTGEGQTAKVAERIDAVLQARGHDPTTVDVGERPDVDVEGFDAVLVGASIHAGKHQTTVRSFVSDELDVLEAVPTAFFQVSLSSATEEGQEQAAGYVEGFIEETGWHPDRIGKFGGALRFSEYGFLKRLLMKQIVKRTMEDVEAAGDTELTDWAAVEAFANDVGAFVEGRLGEPAPAAS